MAGRSLVVAVLLIPILVVSVLAGAVRAPVVAGAPRPFVPLGSGPAPLPAPTTLFYMQEGATIAANDGLSLVEPSVLHLSFTVRSSPYATGYELNGLSDSGDWYQAIVTDNWPGCLPGLAFADEEWNAAGATAGVNCWLSMVFAAGDVVDVTIGLNCPGSALGSYCISVRDVTRGTSGSVTGSQPDASGTRFVNQPTPANVNGYFTGPMTEVIDSGASSCRAYISLPQIDYVFGNGSVAPSAYVPWSDEFEVTGSGTTLCYEHFDPMTNVSATPVTQYTEASGGSSYGPHWLAGQDWSAVPGQSGGWRFQTDVQPIAFSLSLAPTSLDVGQNATATGTPSGGLAPYTCQWTVAVFPLTATTCTTSVPALLPGQQLVHAYLVDADLDYAEAQGNLTVFARLTASLATDPPTVLVGQPFTIGRSVSGGRAPFNTTWNGVPQGCTALSAGGNFSCVVSVPGAFTVNVTVTDANHMEANASLIVLVTTGTQGPSTPGPSASTLEAATVLILIVVVVIVALLLARRGRQQPPTMPPPTQWPPPPPPPPTPPPAPPTGP